jgi:hypothetical protein
VGIRINSRCTPPELLLTSNTRLPISRRENNPANYSEKQTSSTIGSSKYRNQGIAESAVYTELTVQMTSCIKGDSRSYKNTSIPTQTTV